jgi:mRNA-degrading endonuclease RelE of RelBE toxin-antitoxin system
MDNTALYEVEYYPDFEKGFKRYFKKKRFIHLPAQIRELVEELEHGQFSGSLLFREDEPEPYEVYKKRLPNPDANKGESHGYRVVYLARHQNKLVAMITIYYKGDKETVPDSYIRGWVDAILMAHSD